MLIKSFFDVLFEKGQLKWIFQCLPKNLFMSTQNRCPQNRPKLPKYTKTGFWECHQLQAFLCREAFVVQTWYNKGEDDIKKRDKRN